MNSSPESGECGAVMVVIYYTSTCGTRDGVSATWIIGNKSSVGIFH